MRPAKTLLPINEPIWRGRKRIAQTLPAPYLCFLCDLFAAFWFFNLAPFDDQIFRAFPSAGSDFAGRVNNSREIYYTFSSSRNRKFTLALSNLDEIENITCICCSVFAALI